MRTLIALLVGSALALAFVYAAQWMRLGRNVALGAFLIVWLIACVLDARRGIGAGYAASTESLIHAFLFVVPALIAVLLARSLLR